MRSRVPGLVIRTSVMVGFPGETEEMFQALKTFVGKQQFEHLGCFTYSKEEGTGAAKMSSQVDDDIKQERQAEIMELQQEISRKRLEGMVGKQFEVLVSGLSEESDLLGEGRLSTQAPEVDGVVYLNEGELQEGKIAMVEIVDSHDYDLVGRIVSPKSEE